MAAGHTDPKLTRGVSGLVELLGCRNTMHRPLRHEGTQRLRLQRLVEHLDRAGAGGLAHAVGAIGSDECGRNFRSELPPQLCDRLDAIAQV